MVRVKGRGGGGGWLRHFSPLQAPPPFPSFTLALTLRVAISILPSVPLS